MPTLDFRGKQFIYSHHLTVPFRTLAVDAAKSFKSLHFDGRRVNPPSLDENLIIHGDNLHALKALLPKYAGKIKCVYIDPPYNTGNEGWVYNDNVNSSLMQRWLAGNAPIDVEDLERHDKWLCMMWPRLHLLRELLSDDGVVFISIDQHEVHHLRMLMDEIFGAENFVNCFVWVNNLKGRQISQSGAVGTHEYILAYFKNSERASNWNAIPIDVATQLMPDAYKMGKYDILRDDIGEYVIKNELHNTNSKFNESSCPNLVFNIHYRPETNEVRFSDVDSTEQHAGFSLIPPKPCNDGVHRFQAWRWGRDKIRTELYNLHFQRKKDGRFVVYTKIRDFEATKFKDLITNIGGGNTLRRTLGLEFPYPKPVNLIKLLIRIAGSKDAIILDSFAGSGTTAHAVLALNREDGGTRKFILIECEDYAETLTAERVRRVINGVDTARDEALRHGLGGAFTYCELGEPIDEEGMLSGETLPSYETLANYIAYVATGSALDGVVQGDDLFFGETATIRFYLIYEPNLAFLESDAAALDGERAERIAAQCKPVGKKAFVYAAHKFLSQKDLTPMGITFCQLPYGIHRIADA